MTPPREPSHDEATATLLRRILDAAGHWPRITILDAALRAAESSALERAAQIVEEKCYNHGPRPVPWCQYCLLAGKIRALASPAAAPAPEKSWTVKLSCCGRDDGTFSAATWAEADAFREHYLNADGHKRSAIIVSAEPAAPAAETVTPELLAAHAADLAAGRHDLSGVYGCSICGTSPLPPSEPAAPAHDLRNQRNRFEKCAQLFAEIRGDWTDPRDACREGRKLCMEALADIDAKLAARAATHSLPGDGSAET